VKEAVSFWLQTLNIDLLRDRFKL